MSESRETMEFDVVIVGAGPAGLAAAIHLKQLAQNAGCELSVCVLEKCAEVGAHILSGAVIDRIGLNKLIPDWKARGARVAGKTAHRGVRTGRGTGASKFWDRIKRIVGTAQGAASRRSRHAQLRLATRQPHRRRIVRLSLRRQSGFCRICGPSRLQES